MFLSQFLLSSWKEGLLPLPEGARLSSSSHPPLLLTIPHTPLNLPHLASMPITEIMTGDSTWAMTPEPSHLMTPVTILGMTTLQHPQPWLAQASSGIISPFHTAPTSLPPMMDYLIIKPLLQQPTHQSEGLPQSGTSPYRTRSTHLSLYERLRNPSPAPQPSTPPESSYWSNITEQHSLLRPRRHRRRWEQINRQLRSDPQPPPELLVPPESRYEYITNETSSEGTLYELP